MTLTVACLICNRMIPAGQFCPHCVTQVKEDVREWKGLNWGDMPIGQTNNFDFMEGARWAEKWLKEKNT